MTIVGTEIALRHIHTARTQPFSIEGEMALDCRGAGLVGTDVQGEAHAGHFTPERADFAIANASPEVEYSRSCLPDPNQCQNGSYHL